MLKKMPGISIDLRYFIAYVDKKLVVEIFSTQYDFAYQIMLPLEQQPNTPYGLLEGSNGKPNLSSLFAQCQIERSVYVANQKDIMAACMRYVSQQVHDNSVVNYITFINQDTYSVPQFSHTYTSLFSPKHLIVNVSSITACLEDIEMRRLFKYLRKTYINTGRHLYDIQCFLYNEKIKNIT